MTIDQIKEFCVVAKLESFTRASEYLYISQSALSRHMLNLEESLNVQLINRGNRVFGLTEAGKVFYDEASVIIDSLETLVRKTQRMSSGKEGLLRLTVFTHSMPYILHKVRSFRQQHEEIELKLNIAEGEDILQSIIAGDTDVGLMFSFDVPENKELKTVVVGDDELCVVVSDDHPLAERDSVSLGEIKGKKLFTLKKNLTAGQNKTLMKIENAMDKVERRVIVEDVNDMFLETNSGAGVALISYGIAGECFRNCKRLKIDGDEFKYDIVLCYSMNNANPALREFISEFDTQKATD